MTNNSKYYINHDELNDVKKSLEILSKKRLLTKFAKTIGISHTTLSYIASGKRDLSWSTLTNYNKIVNNIDNFLAQHEE